MFVLFVFCCLIFSAVFIDSVYAAPTYNGNTASQAYAASSSCSGTFSSNLFCQYNNDNHVTIKISLYYFKNGSRTKIGNSIYYTNRTDLLDDNYINVGRNSVLESADNKDKNLYTFKSMGLNDITSLTGLAQILENKFIDSSTKYAALDTILIQMGTSKSALTLPSQPLNTKTPAKYGYRLIIEPVATMIDSSGNQYALTIKQMASTSYGRYVVNSKHWAGSDGRQFATWAVTQYTDVGIKAYTSSTCSNKSKTDAGFDSYIKNINSGCGYNIIDITVATTSQISCDVNVNNNEDSKYNWTYWDKNCDLDNDGVKDGCWKKIEDGCCDTVDLTSDILNKYPQCGTCTVNNMVYINEKKDNDLGDIDCGNEATKITNYRGTGKLNKNSPKYCLANNNLYLGTVNGKRYGCEIKDELVLPKEYSNSLTIGQYFVWPTSKTLQELGNFNMGYPVTRNSTLKCVAYQYTKDGKLQYVNLTKAELNALKEKFKTSGTITLKYNGNDNGNIIVEYEDKKFNNGNNNYFTGTISTFYTLQSVNKTSGIYAYYNQETLEYTSEIIASKINKYVQYGYPIIPFGNYGEERVNITYGINFDDIDFSKLNSLSGSYICSKDEDKASGDGDTIPCQCESGTLHEGLDLTTYFSSNYDSWIAECSRLRDLKCNDPNTDLVCPNDNTKIMNECVNRRIYGGSSTKEAYNLCVANECDIGDDYEQQTCTGSDCKLDIIYRTIFLKDPFPGIADNDRVAGANWGGSKALYRNGLGTKYITQTADQMYQGEPMYSIELTPAAIKEIRNYNAENNHSYDDFELSCNDNEYCTSNALHNTFSKYLVGGTCQLQANAKIRGTDDCRLTSLLQ